MTMDPNWKPPPNRHAPVPFEMLMSKLIGFSRNSP